MATNHDGHKVYQDGHSNENVKSNGVLLRKCQVHGKFTVIPSSENTLVAVMVVAIMVTVCGRHGKRTSLSNPNSNTCGQICTESDPADSHPAESGAPVTGAFHASSDHLLGHRLAVARQSQDGHQVDEERRRVYPPAMLAGGVVRWEDVVVVVEPFAAGTQRYAEVFGGVDSSVVRPVAPEMSDTVDGPRHIEYCDVTENSAREEGRPPRLTPVMHRHGGR